MISAFNISVFFAVAAMSDEHTKHLMELCRICGEKLSKSKSSKAETSYLCSSNVQFMQDNFGISVEKDVSDVHPPRFCKKCHLSPSRGLVFWEPHQEEECKTCNLATVVKTGGRPSKPKRGRGKSSTTVEKRQAESEVVDFCKLVDSLVENVPSNRVEAFGKKFTFAREVPREYLCPVCLDILDQPVETDCQHYFCSDCTKGVAITSSCLTCPLCKADSLSSIRVLTRMVLNFKKDLQVTCKTCGENARYEDCGDHECATDNPKPRAPTAGVVQAEPVPEILPAKTVQELEEEIPEGKLTPEAERLGTLFVKAKLGSSTDGKTVTVKTGGKVRLCMKTFYTINSSVFPRLKILYKSSNVFIYSL